MTSERPHRPTPGQAIASLGVLGSFLALIVAGLVRTRLWEDEAYNLSVPLNLATGGGYRSAGILNDGVPALFDVKISTGPAVLGPIAPLIAAGVDPVVAGRLIGGAYAVALLVGVFLLGSRIAGRWGGIAAAASIVVFTAAGSASPIQGVTDVLGEIPAAAFLVFGVLAFRRNPLLAGLLVGLAIQSKNLAVIAVPAFLLGAALTSEPARARLLRIARLISGVAIPVVAFELVKLAVLGPYGYLISLRELRYFLLSGGQTGFSSAWQDKFAAGLSAWSLPLWAFLIVIAVVVSAFLLARRSPRIAAVVRDHRSELIVVAALTALWLGWWTVSSNTPVWIRHPAPALLVAGATVAALVVLSVGALRRRGRAFRIVAAALTAALVVGWIGAVALRLADVYDPARETLAEQRAVAETLSVDDGSDRVHGPWGPPVSIAFLQGKRLVLPGEGGEQDGVWMFPPGIVAVDLDGVAVSDSLCEQPVDRAGYRSCVIDGVGAEAR